jgi:HEAT repeat protein
MKFIGILALAAAAYAADISATLEQVATYEYGKEPASVRQLEFIVTKAGGTPEAASLEKQIVGAFASTKTLAGKDALCRALAVIGTSTSVPTLAPMLTDAETAEMARYALEQIPGTAASEALRAALPKAPTASKPGIVVSLGRRKDTASVAAIKPLLASPEALLANAAASALGQIGDAASRDALVAAKPSQAVTDALLVIAQKAPSTSAATIYKRLYATENPEAVRMAALRGLARANPKEAIPVLTAALKSDSQSLQGIAIRELATVEGAGLSKRMSDLPPKAQVRALAALIDSGKPDVLPVLEQSLTHSDESVRVAALHGIAKLGSAKQIAALASRAASTTGDEQAAARSALGSLRGKDADAAVLSAIDAADPKVKVELIRAAGERGIPTAPETLLKSATDTNRPVRAESIRALRETAGTAHVPALVALLVKTEDENDRMEYERTVAAAIRRSKEAPVVELTKAYQAAADPDLQTSLLSVMAAVGNNESLPIIREALKSKEVDVQRAAINALSSWPSPDPMNDLLTLAQTATSPSQQVLALRGYVKLVQIPTNRPPAETAKMLAAALGAAKRPDEKKVVIAAAQRVMAPESLELVKSVASDPAVAAEAKNAITALERGLSYRRN